MNGISQTARGGIRARRSKLRRALATLGPGLITGASDDDPSGIATYSQVGAQLGYTLAWTILLTYPLMVAIQEISARLGRVTGCGIAGNLRRHSSAPLLYTMIALVLVANVVNIAADVGAMGAAIGLIIGGGPQWVFIALVGIFSALLQVFSGYRQYVSFLKWLSLSLLAYVATVAVVGVPWGEALESLVVPRIPGGDDAMTLVVAVLGTTISPYLFFWQAQLEAEGREAVIADGRPLIHTPRRAPADLRRIRIDTYLGMAVSNLAALFIIFTTAATLHVNGITDIMTSAQAAEALRPLAGDMASTVFAAGIIGTGLMGVPVLAGSAAYAVGEALSWRVGLGHRPREAKAFYLTVAVVTLLGVSIVFTSIDPFKALFWSAVINGILAPPIMAVTVILARRPQIMGRFVLPRGLVILGWAGTLAMAVAVVVMILGMVGAV